MRRWTAEERRALLNGIGVYGHDWIGRHTNGRSRKAVTEKIAREFGTGGGMCRGTYSLAQLAEATGYTRRQLQRAGRALGQRWARTGRGGNHLITDDQLVCLVEWLGTDYWCAKLRLYACIECGTERRPHECLGLCRRCFDRHRRLAQGLGLELSAVWLRARVEELLSTTDEDMEVFLTRVGRDLDDGKVPVECDLRRLAAYANAA
jgi:hypothetical protein